MWNKNNRIFSKYSIFFNKNLLKTVLSSNRLIDFYYRRDTFPPAPPATEKDGGQHVIRNERIQTVYSYSLFHMTLCLSNMYVTMQLTQWFQPQESKIISFNKSWSTVILKTVSTWVSVLVYLSTLVIPTWRPQHSHSVQTGSGHIPAGGYRDKGRAHHNIQFSVQYTQVHPGQNTTTMRNLEKKREFASFFDIFK